MTEQGSCPNVVDGVCTHHEGEVARRESDRTRITDLKDDISENKRHVGNLLTFQNIVKGASLLGGLMITGGYLYTYTHSVQSSIHIETNTTDIKELRKVVSDIKTNLAVTNTNFKALQDKLSTTNGRLEQLVDILNEERRDRRRMEIERMGVQNDKGRSGGNEG